MGLSQRGLDHRPENTRWNYHYYRVRHPDFVAVITAQHGSSVCPVPGTSVVSFRLSEISNLLFSTP